jgi:hypothetical protein
MNPYEREVAHLRQVVSTAKIVVTLTAGLAVSFVAAELQGQGSNSYELSAALLTIPMLVATFGVLWLRAPSHNGELGEKEFEKTEDAANRAHWLMITQVLFALLSGVVASIGLLQH